MDYQTLAPSECAAEVLEELLKCVGNDPALKDKIQRLVRQKVRMVFEHCAMIAEDYVVNHDLNERLTGMEVGDRIAEEIRQAAEERRGHRPNGSVA